MFELFICHAADDLGVATAIANRLGRDPEIKVSLSATTRLAEDWEEGLSSTAVLLLLSASSVPERLPRQHWEALIRHSTDNVQPPLACLLTEDCPYPPLLARKNFFRWSEPPREALRAIERWIGSLCSRPGPTSFVPAPLPWFGGRERELDRLWDTLVDGSGVALIAHPEPDSGKTSLAQHFARQALPHFQAVLWAGCGNRSEAAILGDLATQLEVNPGGSLDEMRSAVCHTLGQARVLLVMDDVDPVKFTLTATGVTSILLTSRSAAFDCEVMRIEECPPASGCRPPDDSQEMRLWQAMSVCRPSGFPLAVAAGVAKLDQAEALRAAERLVEARLVDPLDELGGRYRMNRGSLAAAREVAEGVENLRLAHAELLGSLLARRKSGPGESTPGASNGYLDEALHAFDWAVEADWPHATRLGQFAFDLLSAQGRVTEALEVLERLRQSAELRHDIKVQEACAWELSWMRPGMNIRASPFVAHQTEFDFLSGDSTSIQRPP